TSITRCCDDQLNPPSIPASDCAAEEAGGEQCGRVAAVDGLVWSGGGELVDAPRRCAPNPDGRPLRVADPHVAVSGADSCRGGGERRRRRRARWGRRHGAEEWGRPSLRLGGRRRGSLLATAAH